VELALPKKATRMQSMTEGRSEDTRGRARAMRGAVDGLQRFD
jgi:hypothetical protein